MYKGKHIAVVVPAHNEEAFVADVIESVPLFVDRIYPVDDCSTDDTWAEIRRAVMRMNGRAEPAGTGEVLADGGATPLVVPLRHSENSGVGAAIKTGYRRAVSDGADVVAVMNGDGQMDPTILDRIIDPVVEGEADYAKGDRLVTSDHWEGMTAWRLFGNHLLTVLTRIASGYWQMSDPQNGYTAISASAVDQLDLTELYDQYGFLNDVLIRLNAHNMRIADVEMRAVYGDEQSGIRYTQFVPRLSWLLLRNFVWRLRTKYSAWDRLIAVPYVAGVVGSLAVVGSLLASLAVASRQTTAGGAAAGLGLCLLFILVGMVLERRKNAPLETTVRE